MTARFPPVLRTINGAVPRSHRGNLPFCEASRRGQAEPLRVFRQLYSESRGCAVVNAGPDVVPIPTQGGHFAYHWNGSAVDYVKKLDTGETICVL